MALDIENTQKEALKEINNLKKTNEAIDSLDKQKGIDSLINSTESIKEEGGNILQYFLDLLQTLGGQSAIKNLRKKMAKSTEKLSEECKEIIFEELLQFINCNINFVIPSADSSLITDDNLMTIPVKSIDPFSLLKNSPSSDVGKATYEKLDPTVGEIPFSTNKELYARLQTPLAPQNYLGGSGQRLFTVEYDGGENYLVRPVGLDDTFNDNTITTENDRKITDFLRDYYDSIKIFEGNNFLGVLLDSMSGFLNIQADLSGKEVEINGKFGKIIEKLLSKCGDDGDGSDGSLISASALAHLSEDTEVIDDDSDFWNFGPLDLRDLQEETNLKLKGLIKFVTCGDIEGKIDINELNNAISSLLSENNPSVEGVKIDAALENAINGLTVGDTRGLSFKLPNIQVDFDLNILKKLPLVLISLILTPKVLLGVAIAMKAVGEFFENLDIMELLKKLFRLIKKIVKRLKDLILELIWDEVKKYIIKLVKDILKEVIEEKHIKQVAIVNSLVQTLLAAADTLDNFGDCRSILDTLLKYIKIPPIPSVNVPKNLLFATASRPGFSDVRAFQNVLSNLDEAGVNTETMPDGSPNKSLLIALSTIKGIEKERLENGVVKIVTYPQNVQGPGGPGVTESGTGTGLMI
jgi:hypothetical protein